MTPFPLSQRIREARRWLRLEARGSEYAAGVDHYLTTLVIDLDPGDVAALLGSIPPSNRERLRESLRKYPMTDDGWINGSVSVNLIRAGDAEEYARLEQVRMEQEKGRFRRGVEAVRTAFPAHPPSSPG